MDSTKPARQSFDALRYGLYPRFLVNTPGTAGVSLNTRLWNQAVGSGEFVGDCRSCGQHLHALPTSTAGVITWYVAQCVGCHREIAAPNAEVLRRSGRWSEQPAGWMANRLQNLAQNRADAVRSP